MSEVVLDRFEGLYLRGDNDIPDLNHQLQALNFTIQSGKPLRRDSLRAEIDQEYRQVWTWNRPNKEDSLICLRNSRLYHVTGILQGGASERELIHIPGMDGFAAQAVFQRVYISPIRDGVGIRGEKIYVFDGTYFMAAASPMPTQSPTPTAVAGGNIAVGKYRVAIAYETETGHISVPGPESPPIVQTNSSNKTIRVSLPTPPAFANGGSKYVRKHLLITGAIDLEFQADSYSRLLVYYYAPNGRDLPLNQSTIDLNFLSTELVAEASELFDQLEEIPATASLLEINDRLICLGSNASRHALYGSDPGYPERINSVNGIKLIRNTEGDGLTNGIAYHSSIHLFKEGGSYFIPYSTSQPAFWSVFDLDPSVGTHYNGISYSPSGKLPVNDVYFVCSEQGLMTFDGRTFSRDMGWKINNAWISRSRTFDRRSCCLIDTQGLKVYWLVPTANGVIEVNRLFVGEFSGGLAPRSIRWSEWRARVGDTLPMYHAFLFNRSFGQSCGIAMGQSLCLSSPFYDYDYIGGGNRQIETSIETSIFQNDGNHSFGINRIDIHTGNGYQDREAKGVNELRVKQEKSSAILGTFHNEDGTSRFPSSIEADRFSVLIDGQEESNFGIERITVDINDVVRKVPIRSHREVTTVTEPTIGTFWGHNGSYWGYNNYFWGYE